MVDTTFLGKGLKYPLQFTLGTGGIKDSISTTISEGVAHVTQAIIQILRTRVGERVMRRSFGSNLHDIVFSPNDRALIADLLDEVRTPLRRHEPRIIIPPEGIKIVGQNVREGRVDIGVKFQIIGSNIEENLVFPFYLQISDGGIIPTGLIESQS